MKYAQHAAHRLLSCMKMSFNNTHHFDVRNKYDEEAHVSISLYEFTSHKGYIDVKVTSK